MKTYKHGNQYTHIPSNLDGIDEPALIQDEGDPLLFLSQYGIAKTEIIDLTPTDTDAREITEPLQTDTTPSNEGGEQ